MSITDENQLRRQFLFRICETEEELHDWILTFLGLDMPNGTVHPDSNSNPMAMIFEMYSKMLQGDDESFMRVLYYASRDSFKTLGASVIEVLAMLHLNRNVAHMAAISDQAMKAQEYVKRAFRRPHIRDFVVGNNERVTKIVRFYNPETKHSLTSDEYNSLSASQQAKHEEIARALAGYLERENYVKIVICTLAGANSEHVPLFVIDEVDVVANPVAYEESQNIPAGRAGKLPITMLTSTRKQAFGLVQKEIDRAEKSGLKIRHWNIIDVTARCLPERHRPDLVKIKLWVSNENLNHTDEAGYAEMNFKEKELYAEAEAFAGCAKCKLFVGCRTRLATHQTSNSTMLKSIPETIGKFNANSIEMAKAQLLCLKPSSVGLVYGRFDKTRHVLTPAQAYAKIWGEQHPDAKNLTKAMLLDLVRQRDVAWNGGMDWGHTHNFAYVHTFKDGPRCFVTHCISIAELDPDQMLDVCEPFRMYSPSIYADTADPKMGKLFKKNGHRMVKWKKAPGSVVGGIQIVRWMMNPPMGQPNFFIIHDIGEDPHIDTLVNNLAEYHWKTDATGKPTDVPSEDNDDEPDALRYVVMNVFTPGGQMSVGRTADEAIDGPSPQGVYDPNKWLNQIISERTGNMPMPQEAVRERPRMTIEAPPGQAPISYYGESTVKKTEEVNGKKGKKGRLTWDLG